MPYMKVSELVQVQTALAPQDIVGGKTSSYVSLAGIGRALAVLTTATIAEGKKASLQFMQATSAAGAGAKPVGAAVEKVAGAGGEPLTVMAEIKASDLDLANGYGYIAITASSDNATAVNGAAVLVFSDLSFRG